LNSVLEGGGGVFHPPPLILPEGPARSVTEKAQCSLQQSQTQVPPCHLFIYIGPCKWHQYNASHPPAPMPLPAVGPVPHHPRGHRQLCRHPGRGPQLHRPGRVRPLARLGGFLCWGGLRGEIESWRLFDAEVDRLTKTLRQTQCWMSVYRTEEAAATYERVSYRASTT
jgi:hypothetical protein